MKKALIWIAAVLAVLLVVLYCVPMGETVPRDTLTNFCTVLLLGVAVLYVARSAGIRCPNCGCRINPKYGRHKAFDGRFPCPKCGTMIER